MLREEGPTPTFLDDAGEPQWEYADVIDKLVNDEQRNLLIMDLVHEARAIGGQVLLTTIRKTHVEILEELLIEEGFTVASITGSTKNRKEVYSKIKAGEFDVTIGMQQIVYQGASNPKWWHVISTMPYSDPNVAIQLKGRPIRIDPNDRAKEYGYLWEIIDNIQMTRNMGRTRYRALKPHMHHAEWFNAIFDKNDLAHTIDPSNPTRR